MLEVVYVCMYVSHVCVCVHAPQDLNTEVHGYSEKQREIEDNGQTIGCCFPKNYSLGTILQILDAAFSLLC